LDTVQKIIKLSDIESYTSKIGLEISGSFYPNPNQTIILLSPADNFWDIFKKSEEYTQKVKDPIDNWSFRVISNIANKLFAKPEFPFGHKDNAPFLSGQNYQEEAWSSPVGMLVHNKMGLMISYRGALVFDYQIKLKNYILIAPAINVSINLVLMHAL